MLLTLPFLPLRDFALLLIDYGHLQQKYRARLKKDAVPFSPVPLTQPIVQILSGTTPGIDRLRE